MSKKRVNGAWVSDSPRIYNTSTDTITTLPKTIIGDGTAISAYTIKGNMSQSGTPTPQNPIYPQETGDKTANLFDENQTFGKGYYDDNGELHIQGGSMATEHTELIPTNGITTFTIKGLWNSTAYTSAFAVYEWDSSKNWLRRSNRTTDVYTNTPITFNIGNDAAYISLQVMTKLSRFNYDYTMLNTGSTALPYEPFGYKIPISSGNTTTNVYLGEVQSTRQIKQVVFTGQENWESVATYYKIALSSCTDRLDFISSHFSAAGYTGAIAINKARFGGTTNDEFTVNYDDGSGGVTDFKTYLAQQYAAGTPVTVWYVLATPTTGIVNEPIRKIGTYSDSVSGTNLPTIGTAEQFDIDTTLKPSEVSLTYHGWHEHSDEKYVGGVINKFNKDATDISNGYVRGKYLKNTGEETATTTYSISEYIDISIYSKMTLSDFIDGASSPSLCFYDINHEYISGIPYNARYTVTFNVPQQAKYIRFTYANSRIDTAMLTEGSTVPSEYHPYYEWVED